MSLKIVVEGTGKLDLAEELLDEFKANAAEVVEIGGNVLLDMTLRQLTKRKGSATTAALPGEPPEEDTGKLAASFKVIPGRVKGAIATSGIRSNDPAGNRLEYGKTDVRGIRTFPHPFLRPAIAQSEPIIERLFEERL